MSKRCSVSQLRNLQPAGPSHLQDGVYHPSYEIQDFFHPLVTINLCGSLTWYDSVRVLSTLFYLKNKQNKHKKQEQNKTKKPRIIFLPLTTFLVLVVPSSTLPKTISLRYSRHMSSRLPGCKMHSLKSVLPRAISFSLVAVNQHIFMNYSIII